MRLLHVPTFEGKAPTRAATGLRLRRAKPVKFVVGSGRGHGGWHKVGFVGGGLRGERNQGVQHRKHWFSG